MTIAAITGALAAIAPTLPSLPTLPTGGVTPVGAGIPGIGGIGGTGKDFGTSLAAAMDELSATHNKVDDLAVKAATGDLTDVHDYTIAATQASLATELVTAVRNKGVESFNQIMSMPL